MLPEGPEEPEAQPWCHFSGVAGAGLTETQTTLAIGAVADETAVGHSITVDATFGTAGTVDVTTDGPHIAFPSQRYVGDTVRLMYRRGTAHSDTSGRLVYKDSSDDGATWGAESVAVDTPSVDDRDPNLYERAGELRVGWHMFNVATQAQQVYDRAFAGGAVNNTGNYYPLTTAAAVQTGRSIAWDDGDKHVFHAGQHLHITPWRVAIVDHVADTIRLIREPTHHLFEPYILRVDATTLLMVVRRAVFGTTTSVAAAYSKSTDNGATWSDFREFSWTGDAANMILHSSGLVLLAFRHHDGADRYTSVVWTDDAGESWSTPEIVYDHGTQADCSYPSMVERPDGKVLISHYEPTDIRVTLFEVA